MNEPEVTFDTARRLEAWQALSRSRNGLEFSAAIREDDCDAAIGRLAFLGGFVGDARLQKILESLGRDLGVPALELCARLDRLSTLALDVAAED